MVCYGCFAFFLLLGVLLVTLVGYYPLDMDHIRRAERQAAGPIKPYTCVYPLYIRNEVARRSREASVYGV